MDDDREALLKEIMEKDDEDIEKEYKDICNFYKKYGLCANDISGDKFELSDDDKEYYKKFFFYYHRFYSMSDKVDDTKLIMLYNISLTGDIVNNDYLNQYIYDTQYHEITVKMGLPLSILFKHIDYEVKELKYMIMICYSLSKYKGRLDPLTNISGDKTYNKTFQLWERYARVCELVGNKSAKIINEKLDSIGNIIKDEFKIFYGSEFTKAAIRREIKKDLQAGLRLIKSAAEDTFPG